MESRSILVPIGSQENKPCRACWKEISGDGYGVLVDRSGKRWRICNDCINALWHMYDESKLDIIDGESGIVVPGLDVGPANLDPDNPLNMPVLNDQVINLIVEALVERGLVTRASSE